MARLRDIAGGDSVVTGDEERRVFAEDALRGRGGVADAPAGEASTERAARSLVRASPSPWVAGLPALVEPNVKKNPAETTSTTHSLAMSAIATATARHEELRALREEADSLAEALAARKAIERAKGILMQREGLSEAEAFARLRKASQISGRPLKVVAEALVATLAD